MTDLIVRDHLLLVVHTLRGAPPPKDPAKRRARTAALDALQVYALAGRYPRPDRPVTPRARRLHPTRTFAGAGTRAPIFEDSSGTRCAVGHLLGLTRPDLVALVKARDNGAHLPEIVLPALDAWAGDNGLTRDELAWIQPGYCFEIEECDEVVLEAPASAAAACTGPDASLVAGTNYTECQECDGPCRIWAWVTNLGTEPAEAVTVTLGVGADTLDSAAAGTVAPGEVVRVGPLEADSVTCLNDGGWLRVSTPGEDCHGGDAAADWSWAINMGGPGNVEPEACGGGCDENDQTPADGPTCDNLPETPSTAPDNKGCGGAAALLLPLLGLARRRGRKAR